MYLFPTKWFKANPDYRNYLSFPKESVSAIQQQLEAVGNCRRLIEGGDRPTAAADVCKAGIQILGKYTTAL